MDMSRQTAAATVHPLETIASFIAATTWSARILSLITIAQISPEADESNTTCCVFWRNRHTAPMMVVVSTQKTPKIMRNIGHFRSGFNST